MSGPSRFSDLEFDEFQKLDLQMVRVGGMGWHAIKNDRTAFGRLPNLNETGE